MRKVLLIIAGFVIGLIVFVALIWGLMYPSAMRWDDNAAEVECTVVAQRVINHTCRGGSSVAPAFWDCYGGVVNLSYPVTEPESNLTVSYIAEVPVGSSRGTWESVYDWLQSEYPLNATLSCWYNIFDPSDLKLNLVSKGAYIASTVVVLLLWLIACGCVGVCCLD